MFKIDDKVAWSMLDGNIMAGTITDVCYDSAYVKRVDGTLCRVSISKLCRANAGDTLAACEFFQNIGK